DAAREIKALIADSSARVGEGAERVDHAGRTMAGIVDAVQRVTAIMGGSTRASSEQSAGIDQVNRAVMQLDDATQQNAALVEQASAAAHSLQEQATGLASAADAFRLGDGIVLPSNADAPAMSRPRQAPVPADAIA